MARHLRFALGLVAAATWAGPLDAGDGWTPPRGLQDQEIVVPEDNPLTPERIELGRQLFFDKRLSRNGEMSCESCHVPEQGWTDGKPLSPKWDGSVNTRHSPTMYGVAFYPELYWDGRARGLEAQIPAAWKGHMGGQPDAVAEALGAIPGYASRFQAAFGGPPTAANIVKALAAFVRTIHAGDTPWDLEPQGDTAAARGFRVFSEVARCTLCHLPPTYSDGLFHNVGIGLDADTPDGGRGAHLKKLAAANEQPAPPEAEALWGAFKTPTLRGATLSGPYFHDGSVDDFEEAVDFMIAGGRPNPHLDAKLKPAKLTSEQRADLLAFLRSLTPDPTYARPELP